MLRTGFGESRQTAATTPSAIATPIATKVSSSVTSRPSITTGSNRYSGTTEKPKSSLRATETTRSARKTRITSAATIRPQCRTGTATMRSALASVGVSGEGVVTAQGAGGRPVAGAPTTACRYFLAGLIRADLMALLATP